MTQETKENIKEEIVSLQNKLDDLASKLGAEAEETPAGAQRQQEQDVVQNENIPVILIDTSPRQENDITN